MHRLLPVLVVIVVTAAARAAGPTGGAPAPGKTPPAAPACRADVECALVTEDCCDCNAGGKRRAIPAKQEKDYESARTKRCQGTLCPAVMSDHPSCGASAKASCKAGTCQLAPPAARNPG